MSCNKSVKMEMLSLWDAHVSLTSAVITAAALGTGNLQASVDALYANQDKLGDNLCRLTGKKCGKKYAELLRYHITVAIDIVKLALAGQSTDETVARWYDNGKEIAELLSCCGKHIKYCEMKKLFFDHLDCTLEEAVFIINGKFVEANAEYEVCLARAKKMVCYIVEHTC